LAADGAADVEDVFEILEFDGAIDAEIGARAVWERSVNRTSTVTVPF